MRARAGIKSLLQILYVLDANHTLVKAAAESLIEDLEDAIHIETAIAFGCTHFITSDKNLIKAAKAKAINCLSPAD